MLVEDEAIIAKDIENILLNYGFNVVGIFSRAEEAIDKVINLQPDLILMDIVLKGQLDGIEAAKKIYEKIQVPIIYLTAYADEKTISRIVDTVPYGYFLKPFEEKELFTWIQTTLFKFKIDMELKQKIQDQENDIRQIEYLASHDLQEPLRMVASYVRLLQKKYYGKLDTEADDYINFAVDGANKMKNLVNNLLDYSRINHDNITLEKIDINRSVKEAIKDVENEFSGSSFKVNFNNLPSIIADKSHFRTLFYNLFNKEIKNGNPGSIEFNIDCTGNKNEYKFTISSTDPENENENNLSQSELLLNTNEDSKQYMNGFWFSVCRKIVEYYEGRIWISSVPGKNKIYNFTIKKDGKHITN